MPEVITIVIVIAITLLSYAVGYMRGRSKGIVEGIKQYLEVARDYENYCLQNVEDNYIITSETEN